MTDTRTCPGCGTAGVPRTKLACKPCWYRLPGELQAEVNASYRNKSRNPRRHLIAVGAASRWWRANPPARSASGYVCDGCGGQAEVWIGDRPLCRREPEVRATRTEGPLSGSGSAEPAPPGGIPCPDPAETRTAGAALFGVCSYPECECDRDMVCTTRGVPR